VAQDPAAGESARGGSDVNVTIAIGPGNVRVPDVTGKTEAEAITIFFETKLTPGTKTEAFDPVRFAGQVISTSPQTGVPVAEGTPIDYVVSRGPEPTLSPSPTPSPAPTPVPTPIVTPAPFPVYDYRCVPLADAEEALQADGFTVGTITPPGSDPTWLVGGQNPAPGATAAPGTPIDLTVYDPASLATCPP
jgi:beta-lactam-binding protein with PASTA domain